jgi:hypothetical protein
MIWNPSWAAFRFERTGEFFIFRLPHGLEQTRAASERPSVR